jgi:hypothetical protein
LSVSDEGYSRNVSWALYLISTFESLIGIGKINNNLIKQLYRIDSKVVTRSRKAKDRQLIIQWPRKTDNRTNNDTPNFTKDQTTGTPLNTGGELSCSGRISYSRNVSWALYLIATFESLIGIGKINNNLIKQLYRIDSLYACAQNKQYHNIFSRNIQ